MTIGPLPMMRTFIAGAASSPAPRDREELVEDLLVVLRTGRGFGMELQRADRHGPVREALDRAVVEVAVRHDESARRIEAPFVDLELVILGGDRDRAGAKVLHRMVRPVMPEREA